MSNPNRLHKLILSNSVNRRVFALGGEAYIVGGCLRDLIRGAGQGADIDYALDKPAWDALMRALPEFCGTVVELRKDQVVRLALRGGRTLDFSRLAGGIVEDLRGRDFTVNAIAWSPREGLIDPTGGIDDIKAGLIRAVSEHNLQSDPLRLLRAYRFGAELSWTIDPGTRAMVRRLHGLLERPASERITLEFIKAISAAGHEKALWQALEDELLGEIICLSAGGLRKNLKLVSHINAIFNELPEKYVLKGLPQGLSHAGLIRLEALLIGSANSRLSLSTLVRKRVAIVEKLRARYARIGGLSKAGLYRLFSESGAAAVDLLVISGRLEFLREYERFKLVVNKPLFSGDEVMAITGKGPGPELGRLMEDINTRRFAGLLKGRAAVRKWLKTGHI